MVAVLTLARRVPVVAALLALTACGGTATGPAPLPRFGEPPRLAVAMPLPDNAVDNAVARLDGIAAELMASSGIPGMAVAVVHGGKTVYAKGFGVRDTRAPDKVDPDTVFQLASLSKPIAATVVAHQVGIRDLTWDAPIVAHLPWFALSDPAVTGMLTVADLFAHRSGLPDHAGDLIEDLGYDRRAVLERLRFLPLTPVSSPPSEPAMRSGFYGYGFNIGTSAAARTQFSHSGAFELGAATNFVIIPSADVAIVVLTNSAPVGVPETLTAEFSDLVQFGRVTQDWRALYAGAFTGMDRPFGELAGTQPPADSSPPRPLRFYAGTYANDYWGPATVFVKDGALTLSLGPRPQIYPLTHWDGDVFTFSPVTENAPPGSVSAATFNGDRLTLEYFDQDKMGTFSR